MNLQELEDSKKIAGQPLTYKDIADTLEEYLERTGRREEFEEKINIYKISATQIIEDINRNIDSSEGVTIAAIKEAIKKTVIVFLDD